MVSWEAILIFGAGLLTVTLALLLASTEIVRVVGTFIGGIEIGGSVVMAVHNQIKGVEPWLTKW